jgi:putative flavoprotein involved in K+ transport
MLDRVTPSAEEMGRETAESWITAFDAVLARGDERARAELFAPRSHWRNLFGLSFLFAAFSGREHLAHELVTRAREVHAEGYGVDTARLAPRISVFPGREVIEAIFVFATANGPGYGCRRAFTAATSPCRSTRSRMGGWRSASKRKTRDVPHGIR